MKTLTIRHTHENGTTLEGSSKGDGSSEALKAAGGWRWGRSIGKWFIQQSRDKDATQWKIDRAAEALRAAGFDVEVDIDNTARAYAEAEADRQERQEARVERMENRADRKASAADAAEAKRLASLARVPEGGEPIKIGHHSEKRHRKSIDTAWNDLGKSVHATRDADEAARQAAASRAHADYRDKPMAVARRIGRIQKEVARWQKTVNSYADRGERSMLHEEGLRREEEKLAHWVGIHQAHIEDGLFKVYTRDMVKAGDYVKIKGRWDLVHKANPKTVAVDVSETFRLAPGSHWLSYEWLEVQDHMTAEQMKEARERLDAKAAAESVATS